ncbi:MAG: CRTAC1 family protein [Anaerolineae bacterium]
MTRRVALAMVMALFALLLVATVSLVAPLDGSIAGPLTRPAQSLVTRAGTALDAPSLPGAGAARVAAQDTCEPRPITPLGEGFFEDISISAGIKEISPTLPITVHPRAALADIDGDGYDDLIAHNHSGPVTQGTQRFEHVIYHNNGDMTFTDVSAESGLGDVQAAFFAFGDVDNDGDEDVFAGLDTPDHPEPEHTHQILLNDGSGHFTPKPNSGVEAALGRQTAGNAVFADVDGDGDLDLYVGNGHTGYNVADQLFIGAGDGTFKNESLRLVGRGFGGTSSPSDGSMACDFDNDGDLDIFVAVYGVSNSGAQNLLWINDGEGYFQDKAVERGVASLPGGNYYRSDMDQGRKPEPNKGPGEYIGGNGFGVDCIDFNNDGYMDILMADISHPTEFPPGYAGWPQDQIDALNYSRRWSDPSQILINQGPAGGWSFVNEWIDRGLAFNEGDIDAGAADIDNDGYADIAMSRDKKYDGNYSRWDQLGWLGLFHQQPDGMFVSVGETSGVNFPDDPEGKQRMRGSGNINWSDLDHDGDLDLWLGAGPNTTTGHLFENKIGAENDWLAIRLEPGSDKVNSSALGTRVEVSTDSGTLLREVKGSRGTFNSMDTRVVHFGLGEWSCDYELKVTWPDGKVVVFPGYVVGRNHYVTLNYAGVLTFGPDGPSVTPEPTDIPRPPLVTPTPSPKSADAYLPALMKNME